MKIHLKQIAIIFLLCAFIISASACSGNSLSGTWVQQGSHDRDAEIGDVNIRFSGSRFTLTYYEGHFWEQRTNHFGDAIGEDSVRVFQAPPNIGRLSHQREVFPYTTLRGFTVHHWSGHASIPGAERVTVTGTFSIADEQMELTCTDGEITVWNISRTEKHFNYWWCKVCPKIKKSHMEYH
jgi:hypothetical protein